MVTRLRLVIDGNEVYRTADDPGPAISAPEAGTGLYKMRFAFVGLHEAMSFGGFQPLEGEHSIELSLFSQFVNDAQGAYVYDATEFPSDLTFNKATLTGYTQLDVTF